MEPRSYERRASIYSGMNEDGEQSMGQRGSYAHGRHGWGICRSVGSGSPLIHLGCTVSADGAKMGQLE